MRELFEQKVSRKHADNRCETYVAGKLGKPAQFIGDIPPCGDCHA
jgi:hypothetical protein